MTSSKVHHTLVNITYDIGRRVDWQYANLLESLGVSRDPWERFWRKVQVCGADECWPWKAGKQSEGYGSFRLGRCTQYAHRVAWMLTHGEQVPAGLDVLHSCDHKPCCNPAHLSPGTATDNLGQASERGQLMVGRPNHRAVSADTISAIRDYLATHTERGAITEVARLHGVSQSYVSMLMRGKRRQYDQPITEGLHQRTHRVSKLTAEQRTRILSEVPGGPRGTAARLAEAYGVTATAIHLVVKRNPPLRPTFEQAS